MVRSGIPEQVAMKIYGHKIRAVFERYNIVSPEDLKQAALKIAQYHEMFTNTVTPDDQSQNSTPSSMAQLINITT